MYLYLHVLYLITVEYTSIVGNNFTEGSLTARVDLYYLLGISKVEGYPHVRGGLYKGFHYNCKTVR